MRKAEILEALAALEQAASALADIATDAHPDGVMTAYREAGGALGGIAEVFIAARREARKIIDRCNNS